MVERVRKILRSTSGLYTHTYMYAYLPTHSHPHINMHTQIYTL